MKKVLFLLLLTITPAFAQDDAFLDSVFGANTLGSTFLCWPQPIASTGQGNTFVGQWSGHLNTTGSNNVSVGNDCFFYNTTGNYNSAVGEYTLYNNTSGFENVAFGTQALSDNTSGAANVSLGFFSLPVNTTGQQNTAVGTSTLQSAGSAGNNTAIGYAALWQLTGGGNNTAIGQTAGQNLISGANNVYIEAPGNANDSGQIAIGTAGTQTACSIPVPTTTAGLASTATNTYLQPGSGGFTNSGTKCVKILELSGSSMKFTNTVSHVSVSIGSAVIPYICLEPGEAVSGTTLTNTLIQDGP